MAGAFQKHIIMAKYLSKNFTLEEFIASNTAKRNGIDNGAHVTPQIEKSLANLAINALQPVRDKLGFAMTITSGFRCAKLNALVGGSKTSQHPKGEAADIQCFTNGKFDLKKTRAVFAALSETDVDQLLYERDSRGSIWVHVSYVSTKKNRHMIRDNYFAK